jgi:hypothetical protein
MSCILVQLWFNIYFTCFWVGSQYVDWLLCFSRPWKMTTPYLHVSTMELWQCHGYLFPLCNRYGVWWTHYMERPDMWRLSQRLGNFYREGNWNSHRTMKCCDEVVKPDAGMNIKWPTTNLPDIPKLTSKPLHEHMFVLNA